MPTTQQVINDPDFQGLPDIEKKRVLLKVDKDFRGLPDTEQDKVVISLSQPQIEQSQPLQKGLQTPEWAGKYPNVYGAYGAAKETGLTLGKSVSNIPESAAQFGKNIITPIIHPIQTAKGIGNLFIGTIEKLVPGVQDKEKYADALGEFLVKRYGGLENIKKTIEQDPVGVMADASTFLTAGGAAATKVGQISKVGTLEKVGSASSKIGKAIEPINVASKITTPIVREGIEAGKQVLGMTTGVGRGAIEKAIEGKKLFRESIKGRVTQEEMLDITKDALAQVKDDRAKDYIGRLEQIKDIKSNIDITPIRNKLAEKLKDFNIKVSSDNTLDFSRATLDKRAFNDVQAIYDKIMTWGTKKGDRTPIGLDILKRTLDDFYTESNNSRALVSSLRNEVRNTLVKNVPEYGTMVKNYEQTTDFLKEFDRALSTGKQAMADTAIRKLMSTQREGFEFRKSLLTKMEEKTGKDIQGMVSGISMQQITPKGLIGKLGAGTDIALAITMSSPHIATALLMASPHAVGEFLYWVGKGKRGYDATSHLLGINVRNALQQVGKVENVIEKNNNQQEEQSLPPDIEAYKQSLSSENKTVTANKSTETGHYISTDVPYSEAIQDVEERITLTNKSYDEIIKSLPAQLADNIRGEVKVYKKKGLTKNEARAKAIDNLKQQFLKEKADIERQVNQ